MTLCHSILYLHYSLVGILITKRVKVTPEGESREFKPNRWSSINDKKSLEKRRSLKAFKVSSWLYCFVSKNTNFCNPLTVVFREKKGQIIKSSYADQIHGEKHKRVEKVPNKVQRLLTKIRSFLIQECWSVCGQDKRAKGQRSLSLLPLLAFSVQF